MSVKKMYVMAIRPKYAEAIYGGRKLWEFRKVPPPVGQAILIYESAPVSRITGYVAFDCGITAMGADGILGMVNASHFQDKKLTGIGKADLEKYVGGYKKVTALHVALAEKYDKPIDLRRELVPQNWRTIQCVLKD